MSAKCWFATVAIGWHSGVANARVGTALRCGCFVAAWNSGFAHVDARAHRWRGVAVIRRAWWPAAVSLPPEDVEQYLRARGWAELSRSAGRSARFEKGAHEILVPLTREVGDYALRLADVVEVLEETEEKTPTEIVAEISQPGADVLDFRLRAPDIGPGTIALPAGLDALSAAAEALAAALATALEPRQTHRWAPRLEIEDYLSQVLIGPAEPGSYAVRFLCPPLGLSGPSRKASATLGAA